MDHDDQVEGLGNTTPVTDDLDEELLLQPAVGAAPALKGDRPPGPPPPPRHPVAAPWPTEFGPSPDSFAPSDADAEAAAATPGGWKQNVARARGAARAAVLKVERTVRSGIQQHAEQALRARFPLLAFDRFECIYEAKARHGALLTSVEGLWALTSTTLCFAGTAQVGLLLPLCDIVSVQPAVMLSTALGHPPFFLPTPNGDVLPDAFQVYTRDQTRYTFHGLSPLIPLLEASQTPLQRALTYLDHLWRRALSTVPLPDITYADGPSLPTGCESEAA